MLGLLEQIARQTVDRISSQIPEYAPGLFAALFILAVIRIIAKTVRWLLLKMIKENASLFVFSGVVAAADHLDYGEERPLWRHL